MTEAQVIDGEATEEPVESTEIAMVPNVTTLAVTPTVEASELKQRLDVIGEAQKQAMVVDVDYGVIPGTNKPTLLKPGAEKLSVLFQLDVQLDNEKEWGPGDHLTVTSKATVYHAPTGSRLGYGEGICTTREKKYAKRKQQRACPICGEPAVIKGKAEYGGGWLCFAKKGGCGAKWSDGEEAIESQEVGEIENPELPDCWNTVVKMAEKRARVDAVLAVTGASALFTQDVEDQAAAAPVSPEASVPVASQQQAEVLGQALNWFLPPERSVATWDRLKEICGGEITGQVALAAIAVIAAHKKGQDPDQGVAAEQDKAAEEPDAPSPDPVPAAGIEDELPADTEGPS